MGAPAEPPKLGLGTVLAKMEGSSSHAVRKDFLKGFKLI
jgi:hypothetical protein